MKRRSRFCIFQVVAGQIRRHAIPSCLKAEDRLLQFIASTRRHQANFAAVHKIHNIFLICHDQAVWFFFAPDVPHCQFR